MSVDKDIEKIFYSDSRDKKRIGSNVSKRALRRGGIRGGMKTQYDFLTTKEKKALNGKVMVKNMYDKYKDINNCDIRLLRGFDRGAERVAIFKYIKANHSVEELMQKWDTTRGNVFNIFTREITNESKRIGTSEQSSMVKFLYEDIKSIVVYALENDNVISYDVYKKKVMIDKENTLKKYAEKYPVVAVALLMGVSKSTIAIELKKNAIKYKLNTEVAWNMITSINAKYTKTEIDDILISKNIKIKKSDPNKKAKTENVIVEVEEVKEVEEIKSEEKDRNEIISENTSDIKLKELEIKYNNLLDDFNKVKELLLEKEKSKEVNGIYFSINGTYEKEEIEKRLVSASYILSENHKYNISLKIAEVEEVKEIKSEVKAEVITEVITEDGAETEL